MIVLDTHALLWWALDPQKLSATAATRLRDVELIGGYASTISLWELGHKIKQGKLEIGIPIFEFVRRIDRSMVQLLPVDTATWMCSIDLPWDHRDPADRVIVATALLQGVPLLTADTVIHRFTGVTAVW